LTAKAVCDVLLEIWQFTGCSSYVSTDLGTNSTSQLTKEFEKRLGWSPRFNCPFRPSSTGLAERGRIIAVIYPLVCVLKGKDGRDGVRLKVDYRNVNRFTRGDVFLLPDIGCVFQCRDRERGVGNVKRIISKLATDHPKQWHKYVPMAMWCIRETINETTGP